MAENKEHTLIMVSDGNLNFIVNKTDAISEAKLLWSFSKNQSETDICLLWLLKVPVARCISGTVLYRHVNKLPHSDNIKSHYTDTGPTSTRTNPKMQAGTVARLPLD